MNMAEELHKELKSASDWHIASVPSSNVNIGLTAAWCLSSLNIAVKCETDGCMQCWFQCLHFLYLQILSLSLSDNEYPDKY